MGNKRLTDEERRKYRAEWRRKDRALHPEKYKDVKRKHYEKHREKILRCVKQYQENNSSNIKERKRISYNSRDPLERRDYQLIRHYGISHKTYEAMFELQNGRCLICEEAHELLEVDHCHIAGHVRGLLCGKCNRAIGLLRDDPKIAKRAFAYLSNKGTQ